MSSSSFGASYRVKLIVIVVVYDRICVSPYSKTEKKEEKKITKEECPSMLRSRKLVTLSFNRALAVVEVVVKG